MTHLCISQKDIDGDGQPELVIFSGAYLHVFIAGTNNDYQLFFLKRENNRRSVQVYDFDGNGKPDFLISKDELDSLGRSRLKADIYLASNLVSASHSATSPKEILLKPNYPNPFNPTTTIKYDLPEPANVSLIIYDVLGRKMTELVNEEKGSGYHSVTWNATNVASGVYLARFTASDANGFSKYSRVNKLVLMK